MTDGLTRSPDDVVNMFWTSGTTGNPKGALATHRVLDNIWNYAQLLDHSHKDRCLAATPLFYTTANYWVMLVALMHGACIVPLFEFAPDEALTTIDREKVTLVVGIPNQFITYLNHPEFGSYSLQSVRRIWSGGAMLPLELAEKLVEVFELDALHQVYGMTETGGITTVTPADLDLEEMVATVGRPLPGFELRLVDTSSGEDVGPGREGELWVRSPYNPPATTGCRRRTARRTLRTAGGTGQATSWRTTSATTTSSAAGSRT